MINKESLDKLTKATDSALLVLNELAEEFRVMGIYDYEEMVRSQRKSISGALIVVRIAMDRLSKEKVKP